MKSSLRLNRKVSDLSLVLTKRKPFDFLVERPFLKKNRGDRTPIELFASGASESGLTLSDLLLAA